MGYTTPINEFPKAFKAAHGRKSQISFNEGIFSSKKESSRKNAGNVDSGMHRAGVELEPARTVSTHEFGHVINYALGFDTGQGAIK